MESCVADEGIPNIIGLFRHLAAGHGALGPGWSSLDKNTEHCYLRGMGGVHGRTTLKLFVNVLTFVGLLTLKSAAQVIWKAFDHWVYL